MRVGRIREVSGDCNLEREREWNVKRVNAGRRRQPDEEDDGGSNRIPDESAMMWREAAEAIDNTRGEKDMVMVCVRGRVGGARKRNVESSKTLFLTSSI